MFELTGSMSIDANELTITYTVANPTAHDVFVAQVPLDGRRKAYPDSAYVALSDDGQRLNLLIGASPLPLDRDVEVAVGALYAKLEARMEMKGTIRLLLPVFEWNAYCIPHDGLQTDIVAVKQVALEIEAIPRDKATRIEPAFQHPEFWDLDGEIVRRSLEFTSTSPIPVRKLRLEFPRR